MTYEGHWPSSLQYSSIDHLLQDPKPVLSIIIAKQQSVNIAHLLTDITK